MPRDRAGLFRRGGEPSNDVGRRQLRVRPRVPLRSGGSEALLGRPGMNGHDRDGVVQADDLADAGHRLRLRFVDRDELAAEGRRGRHDRRTSFPASGCRCRTSRCQSTLPAVSRRRCGVPISLKSAGLERHLRRHRQLRGGIVDQLAVAEPRPAGRARPPPFPPDRWKESTLPALSGGTHEHDSRASRLRAQRERTRREWPSNRRSSECR